ncbi:MAG TPA: DinB family protein [Candidatus Acidoferrum sp.]|nr:DinB family protein [Candidatus Acidoferrum sp.]
MCELKTGHVLTNVIRKKHSTFSRGIDLNIKDLFGYNWYSRRRLLKSMEEIPWRTVVESVGASFESIRDIFVHSLQAEHFWIRRLSGKDIEGIYGGSFAKYADVNSIREYADIVEAETNEYLEKLTNQKLQSMFEYKGRDGSINRNVTEDVLMHVVEEEIHHRGEILCIYWQHDIQAPYISYTAYKGQTTH